jgi:hypothetical protein
MNEFKRVQSDQRATSELIETALVETRADQGQAKAPSAIAVFYLNEFTFRFNRRFYPFNAFRSLLGIAGDTTAPTYAGLYSGRWRRPNCSGYGH